MHGCKVGRTLRRLEVGEVIRKGDGWMGEEWMPAIYLVGAEMSRFLKTCYRPLTPEEVKEHREAQHERSAT